MLAIINKIKTLLAIYTCFILDQCPIFSLVDQYNFAVYTQDALLLLHEITTLPHPGLVEFGLHLHS